MMIEKFGYFINSKNRIKVYRVVGENKVQSNGKTTFMVDESKVAQSYLQTIKYKIGIKESWNLSSWHYGSFTSNQWFDTRTAAEDAAKEFLAKSISVEIARHKTTIEHLYKNLSEMQADFTNCGGKVATLNTSV